MNIEYRGHSIEVTATEKDALWVVDVCIEALNKCPAAFGETGEIDGATNQSDAEIAGLQWGKYRVDLFALGKLKPLYANESNASPSPLKSLKNGTAVK